MATASASDRRAAIEAKGVSKVFQGSGQDTVTALDRVSVTILENEFFTLTANEIVIPAALADKGHFSLTCPPEVNEIYTKIWTDLMK